ncbi:MAG: DNRLRE domain-containing protein, partial [Gammaproteobacteria bacterium]|nr:DNRLRE domain-containing protein [Gammaproteobacteria bacterium]
MNRSSGYLLLPVVMVIAVVAAVAFLMNRESAVDIRTAGAIAEADAARYVAEAGLRHAMWRTITGTCSGYGITATTVSGHSYKAEFTPDSGSPVSVTATGTLASGAVQSLRQQGVRINQAPTAFILEPDAAAGKDARIYEWKPTWNYGQATDLSVEGWVNSQSHSLIRFDLSGIPAGAEITGAILELYQNTSSSWGGAVQVHRLTRDWVEGDVVSGTGNGATWNESEPGIPWTTPGGDFDPAAYAVTTIPAGVQGWFQWDVTDLVKGWHGGAYSNHGLLLKPHDSSVEVHFSSS